jgi:acyl dehydratase
VGETVRYDDVTEGLALPPGSYHLVRRDLVMYAGASGDFNDIHWDPGFAKAVGLPDTIATGMHTMGRIGGYLTEWCGDPGAVVRFRNRFSGMIIVPDGGADVSLSASVAEKIDGNRVRVTFEATADGSTVSKGEAVVQLA